MRENRLVDHGVHTGIFAPIVGHRRQNIVEYSVIQYLTIPIYSRRVTENTLSPAREEKGNMKLIAKSIAKSIANS